MNINNQVEAENLIQNTLDEMKRLHPNSETMLVDTSLTDERNWGWIIYYQSKKYIETKDIKYMLAGNGSYFVNKNTGEMIYTGTSEPIENYVEEYEKQLSNNT
jgi:hypothetical protein